MKKAKPVIDKAHKEELNEFLRGLWKEAKVLSTEKKYLEAFEKSGLEDISITSFSLVYNQMLNQKLEGIPYIDARTFNKWKELGFKVKKGEKSTLKGVAFLAIKEKGEEGVKEKEEKIKFLLPKMYHLFHRNQVMPV